jgi:hypothetical protein
VNCIDAGEWFSGFSFGFDRQKNKCQGIEHHGKPVRFYGRLALTEISLLSESLQPAFPLVAPIQWHSVDDDKPIRISGFKYCGVGSYQH